MSEILGVWNFGCLDVWILGCFVFSSFIFSSFVFSRFIFWCLGKKFHEPVGRGEEWEHNRDPQQGFCSWGGRVIPSYDSQIKNGVQDSRATDSTVILPLPLEYSLLCFSADISSFLFGKNSSCSHLPGPRKH